MTQMEVSTFNKHHEKNIRLSWSGKMILKTYLWAYCMHFSGRQPAPTSLSAYHISDWNFKWETKTSAHLNFFSTPGHAEEGKKWKLMIVYVGRFQKNIKRINGMEVNISIVIFEWPECITYFWATFTKKEPLSLESTWSLTQ